MTRPRLEREHLKPGARDQSDKTKYPVGRIPYSCIFARKAVTCTRSKIGYHYKINDYGISNYVFYFTGQKTHQSGLCG